MLARISRLINGALRKPDWLATRARCALVTRDRRFLVWR